jgi:maltooligosyltrehalose trehalohydrolase
VIFSVWAPFAKSVDLVTQERRIAMQSDARGYWRAEADASSGRGYKYAVDGGTPLPDPCSRWQPDGVHGASHMIDADSLRRFHRPHFRAAPLSDAVIYELHVGTFTPEGTYAGAQAMLPHLVKLGITHVELMPVATFPGRHGWGYDGVDLYAPLPAYGSPEDLARFVAACHDAGLGVLLDVVYNHLGPDGNYLGSYGPYFTDRVKTAWGEAVNYDGPYSDEVRRFVIDNALMWLRDYAFDGLRLDAVHAIFSFEATHILEELSAAVRRLSGELNRSLVLIAESDLNDPRLVHSAARGGYALEAHWEDDFHHALHRFFTGETAGYYADFHGLEDIATALREGYVYQGKYSEFRHRSHGRAPRSVAPEQLVVCAQNHDQVGNRAQGERLSMLIGVPQLKAVAALTLLSPFVPLLFQGEEWGATTPFLYFTDHQDPTLGRLVAEGRAKEFSSFRWAGEVPNPQEPRTFERSKLDWSELAEPAHADLFDWHRRLIELRSRKSHRDRSRKARVKVDADARWLQFQHAGVLVQLNLADEPRRVPLPAGAWELALSSEPGDDGELSRLPAHGTRIHTQRVGGGAAD